MPATQTIISHSAVSTIATAQAALRDARSQCGYGSSLQVVSNGTDYSDIYAFTNGTGTFATTYLQCASQISGQYNQWIQGTDYNAGNYTGLGTAVSSRCGFSNTALYSIRNGANYRSLVYKPSSGTDYGAVIYQLFDTTLSAWKTVSGEIFIKPQNKPSSFSENLAASTLFMYYESQITRFPGNGAVGYYDAYRWMYVPSPYTGWAGTTPVATVDHSALLSRACSGTTSHQSLTGFYTSTTATIGGQLSGGVTDYMAANILPMTLDVWALDATSSAKLAQPFILKHKMRPIGTAGSDFCIGPVFEAGFEVTVSPTEKYWSLGASLFVRQA